MDRIGVRNRWCFEVGASDGLKYSNVRRLIDEGWNAVLIESDPGLYEKLKTLSNGAVHTVHAHIDSDSLEKILTDAGAPLELDLGVIDIDGQDYWVWDQMCLFRPRLMLVEFALEQDSDFIPELGRHRPGQAGRDAIIKLGKYKGYEPIGETHVNLLFCQKDLL